MVTVVVETASDSQVDVAPAPQMDVARALEQECQTWDWARTAGVSAQELRKALRDSLGQSGYVPD